MPYSVSIPGVPGGPIEFSFPVYMKIAPTWRTNVRPGLKARQPRRTVQHETANPRTYAVDDATYMYNGSGGRTASWHATVDHREAYIGIPFDEVTWQAGDGAGPGNYNGISCELAVHTAILNNASLRAQSQKNAAELMGKTAARLNALPPATQHANYMNKNCPMQMRNRGEWTRYLGWWHQFYNEEKARMAGGTPAPTPQPTGWKAGDTFKVTADAINIRGGYSTTHRVVGKAVKGAVGRVITDDVGNFFIQYGGYPWLNVSVPGHGTGWMAIGFGSESWVEKTAAPKPDPKPDPKPTYAPRSPVKELLDTNFTFEEKYNTAEGITTINELEFIFVADVIEFKRTTKALQYGDDNAKEVRAPYQEGERAIAAWLVKGTSGVWYYLLTGGDDEWVRVEYVNTVRVSDAPLLGDGVE